MASSAGNRANNRYFEQPKSIIFEMKGGSRGFCALVVIGAKEIVSPNDLFQNLRAETTFYLHYCMYKHFFIKGLQ
jgi:hypothetical protein